MHRNEVNTQLESHFGFDELFFSRTNHRGIILSGNSVFQRVSQYSWSDLIGKPHNLIRHSDMPKGVFFLLWDFLLKGRPISAYVKNRAKDGSYYWVFALALPCPEGFISIRLKPSSAVFTLIKDYYQELLSDELKNKLTPEASQKKILETVKKLGFESYVHFMTHALSEELNARQMKLSSETKDSRTEGILERQKELVGTGEEISKAAHEIMSSFKKNQFVSLNLQIEALNKSSGQTMGKVAEHFHVMSSEVEKQVNVFDEVARKVQSDLKSSQFLLLANTLINEMLLHFKVEPANEFVDAQAETKMLEALCLSYQDHVIQTLREAQVALRKLGASCEDVGSINNGLEIIRLTGNIEASRSTEWGNCQAILKDLHGFLSRSRGLIGSIQAGHLKMLQIAQSLSADMSHSSKSSMK